MVDINFYTVLYFSHHHHILTIRLFLFRNNERKAIVMRQNFDRGYTIKKDQKEIETKQQKKPQRHGQYMFLGTVYWNNCNLFFIIIILMLMGWCRGVKKGWLGYKPKLRSIYTQINTHTHAHPKWKWEYNKQINNHETHRMAI